MIEVNKRIKAILLAIGVMCFSVTIAFAQGPGFDEDVDDVPVPFDGGVTLVAAAAVGYGIKKIRDNRRK